MPIDLDEFNEVAEDFPGRTIQLTGVSSALLFSAISFLQDITNWSKDGGLSVADIDYIDAIVSGCNYEVMTVEIGSIVQYITDDPPAFTLPCDGSTQLRTDYPLLYAVLDPAYIVDADNFVLPDFRSRSPIGAGEGAGLSDYAVNQMTGEENHQLTVAELASHNHALFEISIIALTGEEPVLAPFITSGARATDLEGGDTPHNTIHPVTAVKFAVRYQ